MPTCPRRRPGDHNPEVPWPVRAGIRLARPHPAHGQNWSTFLKNHAQQVWACDFLPVIDLFFRQIYAFFIIDLGSRRVVHCGVTSHPTDAWVAPQLREATPFGLTPRFLLRDRDSNTATSSHESAKASSIEVLKTPYRAPKANAICERFLGSVRRECLDHILVFGDRQLHRVIKKHVEYFNRARPHQGIGQRIPEGIAPQPAWLRRGSLVTVPVLNGLHHDDRRAARVCSRPNNLGRGFRLAQGSRPPQGFSTIALVVLYFGYQM